MRRRIEAKVEKAIDRQMKFTAFREGVRGLYGASWEQHTSAAIDDLRRQVTERDQSIKELQIQMETLLAVMRVQQ